MNDPSRRWRPVRWGVALGAAALIVWLAASALGAHAQTPTRTPRPASTPPATATPRATQRATPTQSLTPSPTPDGTPAPLLRARVRRVILPAPSVKNQLVGDVVSDPDVPLSANYPTLFGDRIDFGMANLRDLSVGDTEGDGISALRFTIFDIEGNEVFAADSSFEQGFCAFGGNLDACTVHDFGAYGNRWPGGAPARSGRYTLVAFATGAEPDHKGAWTLAFELRLARDAGLQESDGAVFIRSIAREGEALLLDVETLGFTPFAQGTHLHLFPGSLEEEEAVGGAQALFEFPAAETGAASAYGFNRITIPLAAWPTYDETICVAIAHPDHTVLAGRAACVALP